MKGRHFGYLVDKLRLGVERIGTLAISVVLVVTLLPFTRELLEEWTDLDTTTVVAALVALCIPLLLWSIRDVERDVHKLTDAMTGRRALPIENGVGAIYPYIHEAILRVNSDGGPKRLRVIGLTLYTAWPHVHSWVESGVLKGWTVEMTSILPQAAANTTYVPDDWGHEAAIQARKIQSSAGQCAVAGVTLLHTHYELVPPIHGFSVSDRTLIFSHITLSDAGKMRLPHEFYEVVNRREDEARYRLYSSLFNRWYATAARKAPPESGDHARTAANSDASTSAAEPQSID